MCISRGSRPDGEEKPTRRNPGGGDEGWLQLRVTWCRISCFWTGKTKQERGTKKNVEGAGDKATKQCEGVPQFNKSMAPRLNLQTAVDQECRRHGNVRGLGGGEAGQVDEARLSSAEPEQRRARAAQSNAASLDEEGLSTLGEEGRDVLLQHREEQGHCGHCGQHPRRPAVIGSGPAAAVRDGGGCGWLAVRTWEGGGGRGKADADVDVDVDVRVDVCGCGSGWMCMCVDERGRRVAPRPPPGINQAGPPWRDDAVPSAVSGGEGAWVGTPRGGRGGRPPGSWLLAPGPDNARTGGGKGRGKERGRGRGQRGTQPQQGRQQAGRTAMRWPRPCGRERPRASPGGAPGRPISVPMPRLPVGKMHGRPVHARQAQSEESSRRCFARRHTYERASSESTYPPIRTAGRGGGGT
ncbi:hypothetical protein JHW43_009137 [Diplocarpon mali]|nr:hypothetical protein JHW43_009137 [Diplocarpon mali]